MCAINSNNKQDANKRFDISNSPISKEKNESQENILNLNIRRITSKEIDAESFLESIENNGESGATVIFIGTVRNFSKNGPVLSMNYEAYEGMAEEKIENIEITVKKMWDVKEIKIIHRIGELKIGDSSIAIAISTSHSKDAFEACNFVLDRVKQDVPIWKNERLLNGKTKWVEGKSIKE
ncbi:MAG: molybdenum cofactor biosynthesis protein MoaE [Nitrosopumilus sp.]|nr:molybdenum cofactor biosynthesis protein MoaE [Nitrosopumilus sp.]